MAVAVRATGAVASAAGTNSSTAVTATPALPTGTTTGDRVYIFAVGRWTLSLSVNGTGWTSLVNNVSMGGGVNGATTGPVNASVWYRDVPAGGVTMPTVQSDVISNNGVAARAITLSKASTEAWNTPTTVNKSVISASTAYSATATGSLTFATDGMVLLFDAFPSNPTTSAATLTATGVTFGTVTHNGSDGGQAGASGSGYGAGIANWSSLVSAGSVTARAPTHTATLSASRTGGTVFIQQTASVTFTTWSDTLTVAATASMSIGGAKNDISGEVMAAAGSAVILSGQNDINATMLAASGGLVTINAVREQMATLAAGAVGTLAVAPNISRSLTLALAASGALTVSGRDDISNAIALGALSALVVGAVRGQNGALAVSGSGLLTVGAIREQLATLVVAATSALIPNTGWAAVFAPQATPSLAIAGLDASSGSVSLAGVGGVTFGGIRQLSAVAALSAASALIVAPSVTQLVAEVMAATGSLTISGQVIRILSAVLAVAAQSSFTIAETYAYIDVHFWRRVRAVVLSDRAMAAVLSGPAQAAVLTPRGSASVVNNAVKIQMKADRAAAQIMPGGVSTQVLTPAGTLTVVRRRD